MHTRQQVVFSHTDVVKLARGAGVSLAGKMAGRAIHVLGQVALARLLGPERFGLYAIGWTILNMTSLISPLGLDQGVIRYASQFRHTNPSRLRGVLFQSIGLAVLSGLLVGGGLYLVAPWLAAHVFQKPRLASVIRWFSPAFLLISGLKVAAAATRVSQRMQYTVYAEDMTQPTANLFLFLLFYLLGWGLLGAVAAGVGSFGIALILAVYYVKWLFPEAFSQQVGSSLVGKELLAFSLPASFAGASTILIFWVDRLLVGYFRPAAEVGIYQAVSQSSILFAVILGAFNAIFSPMIADLYHKRETGRLDELFKVSTKWGLYLTIPLFLVMCFASREVMTVVFGNEYETGSLPLVILAVGQLINVGTGAVGILLIMTGHQNRWLLLSGLMLFVSIACNGLLVPRLGLPGAALSTTCAVSGLFISGLLKAKRYLGIWPYDRRYLKGLLAAVLAAGALFLLRRIELGPSVFSLFLTLMISSGVFGVTLLLLGLDAEDQEIIRLIRAHLG